MVEVNFKLVEKEDIRELKDIYTYYIENTTSTFHIGDISDEEMSSILFYDDDIYKSFKIELNKEIVGYILLCPYKKREAYRRSAEVTIYLKPGIIGKGLGRKSLEFIEEVAKANGIKALLSIICGENTASIKAFENMEYEKVGHLKGVGEKFGRILDIVIYEKCL